MAAKRARGGESAEPRSWNWLQAHFARHRGNLQDPQTSLSLKSGNASVVVTGIDKVSKSEDGPMLEITVKPAATREIKFQPGR